MTKLYISPSTQEHNSGSNGYIEETNMNKIADILVPELIRHGFTVKRNDRTAPGVEPICNDSNAWGADYHIAIHSNATGRSPNTTVRGCEMYCYNPGDPTRKGTQMATKIYNRVIAIMPVKGRGIKSGKDTMSEIAHTNGAACLIEIDYHDHAEGAKWIMANIAPLAQAILMGILDQTGVKYIPKVVTPAPVVDPHIKQIADLTSQVAALQQAMKDKDALIKSLQGKIANATAALK